MDKLVAFILSILGIGGLLVTKEFVNFRPEISTQLTKVVTQNPDAPVNPDDTDYKNCPCDKRSGMITHGDGHKTKCTCTNGQCGCVNKSTEEPVSEPMPAPEPVTPVTTTEDCPTGNCPTTPPVTPTVQQNQTSSGYYYSRPILGRIFRRR